MVSSPTMTTKKMKNPDVSGNYEEVFNSEDYREPEFTVEVVTSYGKFELEAFNVGRGFVLEHNMITPVLGVSKDLPTMIEIAKSQLEERMDTMT